MAGSAVVTTTIRLQGEDRASAEIDKAKKSVDHTAKSLEDAASKSDTLQGGLSKAFGGDILGAAKDLGSLMGGGTGLAGQLGMAALGAGAVAVAIAGLAMKAADWSSQLEKLRAATNHALGPDGMERMHALAAAAGGSAEDYGKLAGRLKLMGIDAQITAEQMAELGDRADNVGLDGSAAIAAFGDAIETGKTKALKAYGVYVDSEEAVKKYAKAHNISAEAMSEADKQAALLAAITENLDKKLANVSSTASRSDDAMDRLGNTWSRFKMELSGAATGPLADVMEAIAETVDVTMRWGKVLVALADVALRPIITLIRVQIDSFVGLAAAANALVQRDFSGAAEIAKAVGKDIKTHLVDDNVAAMERLGKAFDDAVNPAKVAKAPAVLAIKGEQQVRDDPDGPSPDIIDKMRQDRYTKAQKAKEAAHAKAVAAGKKHADDLRKQAELEAKTEEEWADRRIKNEAADLDILTKIREVADAKVRDLNMKAVTDPNERAKIRLLELEAQRVKELSRVRDTTFASKKAQDQANMAIERAFAAEKKQLAKEAADEAEKTKAVQVDAAYSVAESVKGAMGQMGASKQALALVDAAIETAKAIASGAEAIATGDPRAIAAAVQHGLAAAAFAAAAAGGGGGGSAPSGGSYAPAAAAPTASAASGGGGAKVTHLHFPKGFVFGTPHELAKNMGETLGSLVGTGYATARGS